MAPSTREPMRIPPRPLLEPTIAPRLKPSRAKRPLIARKPVGLSLKPTPADISRRSTVSLVERGLTRSAHFASHSPIGAKSRSRMPSWGVPDGTSIRPYVAARRTETERCRAGSVTRSPIRKTAPARQKIARTRRIMVEDSPLEGDDLLENEGTEGHHREARVDEHVTRVRVVQRVHVGRVDDRDDDRDEEGQCDEDVGARTAHCGQPLDLAGELQALTDR